MFKMSWKKRYISLKNCKLSPRQPSGKHNTLSNLAPLSSEGCLLAALWRLVCENPRWSTCNHMGHKYQSIAYVTWKLSDQIWFKCFSHKSWCEIYGRRTYEWGDSGSILPTCAWMLFSSSASATIGKRELSENAKILGHSVKGNLDFSSCCPSRTAILPL